MKKDRPAQERLANLWFLEGMDKINRAIQGTDDLDQMMRDVLDQVLAVFDCDRAWLVYPCDPHAPSWQVPMERTKPQYPGAGALGVEIPMGEEAAASFRELLAAEGPLRFDPESDRTLPEEAARRYGFKSFIGMVLRPKAGKPWQFGLHQCSQARVWTPEEERLFLEIGRRLTDALSILLANRNLRESEELYRAVVDQAAEALFLLDYQGRIRDVNPAACQGLGYSREELLGLPIQEVDPLVEPNRHQEAFWEKLAPGKSFNFESQHRRKEGTLFPVEVSLGSLEVGGNKLMLALVHDITERQRGEELLQRSEDRWHKFFKFSPAYISLTTQKDGRYVNVNEAYLRLLNMPREEIIGRTTRELGFFGSASQRESQLMEGIRDQGVIRDLELKVRLKSGEVRIVLWSVQPMEIEGVDYFLSHGLDITDRKAAEEALSQREEEYRTLVNNLPNYIVRYNGQLERTLVNPAWERESGLAASQVIGVPVQEIPHAPRPVSEKYLAALRRTLETGIDQMVDFTWVNTQKKELYLEYTLVPEFDRQGRVSGILAVGHDLTDRKQAEEQRRKLEEQLRHAQKMEAIGTLAGGIAHDFNNILEVIMGYSEMALHDARRGVPAQKNLEKVLEASERAKKLVRQILTFSRKVEHDLKPLGLREVVEQAAQLLRKIIPKMIHLEINMEDDLKAINADANQLEQVILNLGVNAVDAMPEGGKLKIDLKNAPVESQACSTCGKFFSGPHVALSISDTGHGINQQAQEHIFEPFFTTKEAGRGTGLGLSIVYGIVKGHGGHIFCQSAPDAGAAFTLFFPAIDQTDSAFAAAGGAAQASPGGNEKIMLVDDEKGILEVAQWMLTTVGYEVHAFSSGEEAIKAYRNPKNDFDLIIMDLNMPGMGGRKAMKTILEINPQARMLVISGYGVDSQIQDTLNHWSAGFLAKPFRGEDLLMMVRKVLDRDQRRPA